MRKGQPSRTSAKTRDRTVPDRSSTSWRSTSFRVVSGSSDYTLASGTIDAESLPAIQAEKLPRHAVPVDLLARLAFDRSVQGCDLGGFLLRDALNRSLDLSES
jgi:hypothetical protein